MTTTTTAPIATPTAGIIPAGSEVIVTERVAGYFLLIDANVRVRRTRLMTSAEVAAVTTTAA